ncbi:MAG: fasciclin domain-containing protein [Planctomycetia bacterium]
MRHVSLMALGAALLPLASLAVADDCPLAAAKKAQAGHRVQTVAHKAEGKDIVDTAVGAGSFKTLVAAVQAAGLVETLKGDGPFTVFAPTDEAFAKLPAGTVESLLKPENKEKLVAVLTYHVVPGKVKAADVVKLTEAKTVQGSSVKIKVGDAGVMVDNAKVVKTDIETSNGVIHVIDAVILPPAGK